MVLLALIRGVAIYPLDIFSPPFELQRLDLLSLLLDSSGASGVCRLPRGTKGGGDSDSEDEFTSDHTSGPDYDSAGDELNDRVLQALERLHQDMKNVLRRLSSIEETISQSQLVSCFQHLAAFCFSG